MKKYIIESTDNVVICSYNMTHATGPDATIYLLDVDVAQQRFPSSVSLRHCAYRSIKHDLIFERFLLPGRAGLAPADTTIIGEDIESTSYIQITLIDNRVINLDKDLELLVKQSL